MTANFELPVLLKEVKVLHRATPGPTGPLIEKLQYVRVGNQVEVIEFWYQCGLVHRVTSRGLRRGEQF